MFERRLKIFLIILSSIIGVLVLRAAQVQVIDAAFWQERAEDALKRPILLETRRGSIVDRNGRVLACDAPCMDASVDYRAIAEDPSWIRSQAIDRLLRESGAVYRRSDRDARKKMIEDAERAVARDIDAMWDVLARESGKTREEIEQVKARIRMRVDFRRRVVWYLKYRNAMAEHEEDAADEPWYRDFLTSDSAGPELDRYRIEVAEQQQAHVILPDISTETYNRLKKHLDRYPGLVVGPSKRRLYPYQSVACHLLGHLSVVARADLDADPFARDELRQYQPNDLIGRGGVEGLCEETLRGIRGRITRIAGRDAIVDQVDPVPGHDVRLSIDVDLQAKLEHAFENWSQTSGGIIERHPVHGAAVVIDVASGQVLALVSYPTFDANLYNDLYATLSRDYVNQPLLNRATQATLEPGSTVKPMVGISAITQGLITPQTRIECTGYLIIDGRRFKSEYRCWTASMYAKRLGDEAVKHHKIPYSDPHPTGWLCFADAIQRSCNVFFENVGDLLGTDLEATWFDRFGLGHPTGIGLPERSGHIPRNIAKNSPTRRPAAWLSAIGQYRVLATPIQMANVAATIARDGIWMRPQLVMQGLPAPATRASTTRPSPDRVDLHLDPAALAAAKEGMWRVVNTPAGSAYKYVDHRGFSFCGKTGTASAARFSYIKRDADDQPIRKPDGTFEREFPDASTPGKPNPKMPWYRANDAEGKDLSHAWFIGFAPADKPRIAFAIMQEYGGSGGEANGPLVNALLEACAEAGYISRTGAKTAHP